MIDVTLQVVTISDMNIQMVGHVRENYLMEHIVSAKPLRD